MRAIASLGAVIALAGCATGGAAYHEFAASAAAPAADASRLLLFRSADTPQYSVRAATLRVDDAEPVDLRPGMFHAITVAPGAHRIVVDMWDVPGRCELVVEAQGGSERYFEVSPRAANAMAMLPMALVPVQSIGGLFASGAVMMGGLTAESAGKVCGGAFQVIEQPTQQALSRLGSLRAAALPSR